MKEQEFNNGSQPALQQTAFSGWVDVADALPKPLQFVILGCKKLLIL